jgi:4,5:9,10-diseco-3-hydroxy-5,9,17-trioxoandrosta-1(10),2-diene-4-oate hydrolase
MIPPVDAAMQRLLRLGDSAARGRYATVAGVPLHYLEEGSGSAIVLLHGGAGGGANWFRVLHALARRFRVLAPDLPGFGLSPKRVPAAPLGVAAADLLAEWLRGLRVQSALVAGTSFGGLAALRLAQRAPEVVGRLFLLDAAGLERRVALPVRLAALPLIGPVCARPTRYGTARTFRRLLTRNAAAIPSAMQQALVDYLYVTSRSAGRAYLGRTLRLFAGAAGQREVLSPAELSGIARPAMVVLGEHDPFFSAAAARAAAHALPHAEFRMIAGVGHSPNWEAPEAVLSAIDELAAR